MKKATDQKMRKKLVLQLHNGKFEMLLFLFFHSMICGDRSSDDSIELTKQFWARW